MDIKKIYRTRQALVSKELIMSSDSEIDAAISDAEPGMIIYTAGHTITKQKSLDGTWVLFEKSSSGSSGDFDFEIATDIEVDNMLDEVFE